MGNSSYRDPLDGPPPKLERRKSNLPETSGVDWWAHIPDIKRPAKNSSQSRTSSSSEHQKHTSITSVVRERAIEQTLPQSLISSTQGASNVHREDITPNERHIANQILTDCSDMDELIAVCSDLSGTKFQALITPFIDRLSQFIVGETINSEHVLFLLRKTLKITLP